MTANKLKYVGSVLFIFPILRETIVQPIRLLRSLSIPGKVVTDSMLMDMSAVDL